MAFLYELIQNKVAEWRKAGYPSDDHPAVTEILEYATLPESNELRFLRTAQLQALETYWYLRLVEETPHIFELYQDYYTRSQLLAALGIDSEEITNFALDHGMPTLWDNIREDDRFVKNHNLESVRETITLDYPSYILALAMGAGKTILIGAIIATEFAMALEYHPNGDGPFVQNALVFAPGLTIFESLRELADVPYEKIIPPRLHRAFDASYKLTFTQEGQKDIPIIRGSRYNMVVTNTEKIRIQKRNYRHYTWSKLYYEHMLDQYEAEANLRLQAIASLPNLGVFSDEAHHTYGQQIGERLKRVRQTVDYLHEQTNLVCVVNTTGTPYYERQPLRDVVIWYGLSQGIEDNILKSVEGNIYAYSYDDEQTDQLVALIVRDFFETYGDVTLPNGAPAKLALYFPQTKDLREMRPIVERTLVDLGYPTDIVLRNTSNSTKDEIDAFNRLNHPKSSHRVILLVNKGTEGWNCPSLFACALVRQLTSSNNFVLQASTRCLRQVPGNPRKARIYLTESNRGILDRQLQETYGETIRDLDHTSQNRQSARLVVRKMDMPPLVVNKIVRHVVPVEEEQGKAPHLTKPDIEVQETITRQTFTPGEQPNRQSVIRQVGEEEIEVAAADRDLYSAATELAAIYRMKAGAIHCALKDIYGAGETVPEVHLPALAKQIEKQTRSYEIQEEEVEVALALVKPDGFTEEEDDGDVVYTTEITYHKDKEHLLLSWKEMKDRNPNDFGFHYDPYNFDSSPERHFFEQMLDAVNMTPGQVEDIYFTGALTDPRKTDIFIEYLGTDGKWHRYSPDFVIRRKDGRSYIVEIKQERMRGDEIDGERGRKAMAVRKWEELNPDKLKYEMLFTSSDSIAFNQMKRAKEFVERE